MIPQILPQARILPDNVYLFVSVSEQRTDGVGGINGTGWSTGLEGLEGHRAGRRPGQALSGPRDDRTARWRARDDRSVSGPERVMAGARDDGRVVTGRVKGLLVVVRGYRTPPTVLNVIL